MAKMPKQETRAAKDIALSSHAQAIGANTLALGLGLSACDTISVPRTRCLYEQCSEKQKAAQVSFDSFLRLFFTVWPYQTLQL
jgi:hypothetical protein